MRHGVDMQQGHVSWTYSIEVHGHAAWIYSMET
jgi:hypothetical protein